MSIRSVVLLQNVGQKERQNRNKKCHLSDYIMIDKQLRLIGFKIVYELTGIGERIGPEEFMIFG